MSRKEKNKKDWLASEWEEWINEAADMYGIALQNPDMLRVDMWREEYEKRKQEMKERA